MRGLGACLLLAALASCTGENGTIGITVVGAPDSEILPNIERIRATFTNPVKTFEGTRGSDGSLDLSIELLADSRVGDIIVEGYNASDALIAVGRAGPLPLNAINAEIVVYMAPPLSVAEAPVVLDPPRSLPGSAAASFGVLLAGGLGADGPIATVDVYSTYLHSMQSGLDMPAPVSDSAVVAGDRGFVYMVGGSNEAGEAVADSYAFDTTIAPSGRYRELVVAEENARSGASTAIVGEELFIVSGNPGLLLDGFSGTARALLNGEDLDGPAVTLFSENNLQVVFAGSGVSEGAAIYEAGQIRRLGAPDELLMREKHRGVSLPSNEALFLGGSIGGEAVVSAVLYKPLSGSFQPINLLVTPRNNPAVAVTDRYLVVVGGEDDDGNPVAEVEIFDVNTLEPVATGLLQVPRKNTSAQPLVNGQVLIAGGEDADGNPVGIMELFTPDELP
jgi:hypothetical protein